jgi:D-ribose pyranase
MKKTGILNHELSEVIARMGHTDLLVIADAGLPIPAGVQRIDLALVAGVPRFMYVLYAVLGELQVERAIVASEMRDTSPRLHSELLDALGQLPLEEITHEEFKRLTHRAVAIVRTGEFTPYANIALVSGVVF